MIYVVAVVALLAIAVLLGPRLAERLRASGHPVAASVVDEGDRVADKLLPIALEAIHMTSENGGDARATFAFLVTAKGVEDLAHSELERVTGKGLRPSSNTSSGS